MHLVVVHPRLEARGRPFPRSPRSRSRVNPRALRPLTRGPQGQPSLLRKPHRRPGVQGIFPTSRGQAPHGWPMVHHSMATGFPIARGCCSVCSASPHPLVCNPATSRSPVPRPVTHLGLFPASRAFPFSWGCRAALAPRPSLSCPLLPSSRVYTPPGRQQPCGAGPLDPHPSGDRFVRLARVAPFPPPSLSPVPRPVTHLGLLPAYCAFPLSWGCCAALATRPSLSRPLSPSSRVYAAPACQQPFGAGPLDPHPSGDCFVRLALVAPFPTPSVWVVCFFLDLFWALPPDPALASPGTRAYSRPGHLLLFFFPVLSRATRGPSSAPFAPGLPARSVLYALRRCFVVLIVFFSGLPPPPFPLCILPCGSLLPACTHVSTALVIGSRLPSVFVPVPSPSWGVALGGPRPCQVGALPRVTLLSSLSSLPSHMSLTRPLTVALLLRVLSAGLPSARAVSRALSRASWPLPGPPSCRPTWAASPGTPSGVFPHLPPPPASPP